MNNISKAFSNPKMRGLLIAIVLIVVVVIAVGILRLKTKGPVGAAPKAKVTRAPVIESIPGSPESSREYLKLQEAQNVRLAEEAMRKRTAAIPTLTRPTYLDAGVSRVEEEKGCSDEELRRARAAGVMAMELRCRGCSLAALKGAGFTAGELRDAGFNAKELKDSGFGVADLRAAGIDAKELKEASFNAKDLTMAGFNTAELKASGISSSDLQALGISEMIPPTGKGCGVNDLKKMRAKGISPEDLRNLACSAEALKNAGFTAGELRAAGYNANDLRAAGFNAQELAASGFDAAGLKAVGFEAGELKQAGFDAGALKKANFGAQDLRSAGFVPADLKEAGFGAEDLKKAGFSEGDLSRAGFMVQRTAEPGAPTTPTAAGETMPSSPEAAAAAPSKEDWQKQLELLRKQQTEQMSAQEYQDKMKQLQQTMAAQAGDLFAAWSPLPSQQFVQGPEITENGKRVAGKAEEKGKVTVGGQQVDLANVNILKAGTVLFGVLDTGINSDEKSPIMVTLVGGDLKGARLLGDFRRVDKRVVLQFNLLNLPDLPTSLPVNAVAIDPNTARTALATHVDNHYLLRYGTVFASSFMSGIGQAVRDSGSSVSINTSTGENINFHGSTNFFKAVAEGLGEVGNKFSDVLTPIINKPPTVKVTAGSGVGILLMTDLSIPKNM